MNVVRACSILSFMLMVPCAALGGSGGALCGAGQEQGNGRSLQDVLCEEDLFRAQDLKPQQTANASERPTLPMESREATRTPFHEEGISQESDDEMQKMKVLRPDWQRIVGKTGSPTVYRRWLAKQPKAYQRMIESATTAAELNESIEEFLESDDALIAAHQEELDTKLAEMRAKAREQVGTAMKGNTSSDDR